MYGYKACQLVKELASSDNGQLQKFNENLFEEVINECTSHHHRLQSLFRNMQEQGLDIQTSRNADFYGALIHHLSLTRNKRCLMAYTYNRTEVIRSLRWKLGKTLHEEIEAKLTDSERTYFKRYSSNLESYTEKLDLELTVDMVPPKDPYIKVRALDDIGTFFLNGREVNLARYSIHFLKRTDAEEYISQGLMEEVVN